MPTRLRRVNTQALSVAQTPYRWLVLAIAISIAALTWLVFGQTLRHDFVNYDDHRYVYENTKITAGLSASAIAWAFSHIHSENWHPLTTISHMLDCQLYGLKPGGHHFSNVLLHATAAILLFVALWQMNGALWRSAFVAAIFAVHPLHVESVAWIAERKDVLSAVFFMLTLLAYRQYARAPGFWRYLAVVFLFACGLMSKAMLVTVPFVLLLLDYWPLKRFQSRTRSTIARIIAEKVPLVVLASVSGIVTFLAQNPAIAQTEQLPISSRINNALVSYVAYIWQMLWPAKLAVFYPHPENRLPIWQVVAAAVALIAFTAFALALRKRRPYLIVGWLWYIGMLIPVIGILQVGWQGHADRYTYLPQIGLYILIAWSVGDLTARSRHVRQIVALGVAALIAACAWPARIQTSYWRNSETLWVHTLASTNNNDVAENNLGIVLLQKGRVDEAIPRFERAIEIRPENAPAHDNLAKSFLRNGKLADAMAEYRKLLEIQPENVEAHNIMGTVLIQQGRIREAIEQWQEALKINSANGNAKSNLAWVFATCPDESVRDANRAVQLAEDALRLSGGKNALVLRTLAAAYAESGRFTEAVETARRAAELAKQQGNTGLAAELESSIALYQSGGALRDPSLTTKAVPP
ncbi:MAG: tetratricopeptide repeat protein [Chthoniobacterales bacterium]